MTSSAPQRPTSVVVFGILNIVFGVLGIVGTIANAAMMYGPLAQELARNNPVMQAMNETRGLQAFFQISAGMHFVAAVVLVVCGIGLLRLRNWARVASLGYCVYAVAMTIVGTVVNCVFVFAPLMARLDAGQPGMKNAVVVGMIIGMAGGLLALVYPVLLWIFMTRPKVVQAFHGIGPASPLEPTWPSAMPPRETGNPYQAPGNR